MGHDFGNGIGGEEDIGVADDEKHALGRALDQAASGFEDGDAGAFGADESARYVETVFRKQVVQVVAGDAARDVGITLADELAVGVGEILEGGVDFAAASACADDGFEFVRARSRRLSGGGRHK